MLEEPRDHWVTEVMYGESFEKERVVNKDIKQDRDWKESTGFHKKVPSKPGQSSSNGEVGVESRLQRVWGVNKMFQGKMASDSG